MTPTQPSSTPITAEGAVSLLREALSNLYTMTSRYAIADPDYGFVTSAATALAATDPAAIQPAGEAVYFVQHAGPKPCYEWTEVKAERFSTFVDGAFNTRVLYTLRAPQDAKAEQASRDWQSIVKNVVECHKQGMWDAATAMFKLRRCLDDDTPAASNVEAVEIKPWKSRLNDLDTYGRPYDRDIEAANDEIAELRAALARKSAPIEAGEQIQWRNIQHVVRELAAFCFGGPEKLGSMSLGAGYTALISALTASDGLDYKLEPLARSSVTSTADEFDTNLARQIVERNLGDRFRVNGVEYVISRATKPASTPASASIADDAEFFQLLQDWYLQYPNTKSLPLYRKIVDHIDARQSVAAPDARDAAIAMWNATGEQLQKADDTLRSLSSYVGQGLCADTENLDYDEMEARIKEGIDAIIKVEASRAPVQGKASDAEDGKLLDWMEGEEFVALNCYVAVYDDRGQPLEPERKFYVVESESSGTVEGESVRDAIRAARAQQQGGSDV